MTLVVLSKGKNRIWIKYKILRKFKGSKKHYYRQLKNVPEKKFYKNSKTNNFFVNLLDNYESNILSPRGTSFIELYLNHSVVVSILPLKLLYIIQEIREFFLGRPYSRAIIDGTDCCH